MALRQPPDIRLRLTACGADLRGNADRRPLTTAQDRYAYRLRFEYTNITPGSRASEDPPARRATGARGFRHA